jgi:6-pyruvoyltetrahydropterin/6-carboxytetrahydropterin synthase
MENKSTIRITKIFNFEMAHALLGYDGLCKNVHGHSYELCVTVIGKPELETGNPHLGMVLDFGILKAIVHLNVTGKMDHSIVLNDQAPYAHQLDHEDFFQKKWLVPFQPTCENLLLYFSEIIKKNLPAHTKLFSLKLKETPTSFAEWFQADQN